MKHSTTTATLLFFLPWATIATAATDLVQSRAAFEREVGDEIWNEILFNDAKNMLDPSTVDVSGRCLEILGRNNAEAVKTFDRAGWR